MAQSVELLLDAAAEDVLRAEWSALAAAGLPTEQRATPSPSHRPHVTVFAADAIPPAAESGLPALVAGLDQPVQIGSVLVFGPRRDRCIVVRAVTASAELLALQRRVAELCGADPAGLFGPGRWVPHVTLARRVQPDQLGEVVRLLGERVVPARITQARRWDGAAHREWLLT